MIYILYVWPYQTGYALNAILNERVLSRRIHSELLILFFQNARGCAPRVFKVKNQQFLVYSTIQNQQLEQWGDVTRVC